MPEYIRATFGMAPSNRIANSDYVCISHSHMDLLAPEVQTYRVCLKGLQITSYRNTVVPLLVATLNRGHPL